MLPPNWYGATKGGTYVRRGSACIAGLNLHRKIDLYASSSNARGIAVWPAIPTPVWSTVVVSRRWCLHSAFCLLDSEAVHERVWFGVGARITPNGDGLYCGPVAVGYPFAFHSFQPPVMAAAWVIPWLLRSTTAWPLDCSAEHAQ